MHKWRLRTLMADYKISNVELADELGKHRVTVAKMKSEDKMPRMDGDDLDALCKALTKLARQKDPTATIGPWDLYEYTSNEKLS